MMYFEFNDPYYALIKAHSAEEAVYKYIEVVAGEESDVKNLIEECVIVSEYYAAAKFGRARGEDNKEIDFSEITSVLESGNVEVLIIDGCLV